MLDVHINNRLHPRHGCVICRLELLQLLNTRSKLSNHDAQIPPQTNLCLTYSLRDLQIAQRIPPDRRPPTPPTPPPGPIATFPAPVPLPTPAETPLDLPRETEAWGEPCCFPNDLARVNGEDNSSLAEPRIGPEPETETDRGTGW